MNSGLLTGIPLIVAAVVTYVFTFRIIRFAHQRAVFDHPDSADEGGRKLHGAPVPLLGGLGILLGFLLGIIALMPVLGGLHIQGVVTLPGQEHDPQVLVRALGIVIATCLTFVLGLFDDLYHLRPSSKAVGQLAIAITVIAFGVHWQHITNMFGPDPLSNYPILRAVFSHEYAGLLYFHPYLNLAITLLWLMGCMNAMNLSDGLDGLAAGTALIAGAAFLYIATMQGNHAAMLLSAAMCGSALGFLPHNFPKARIFMGDAGSHIFGLLLGAIAIEGAFKMAAGLTLAIPFLILGVPIVDTTWAMMRRAVARQPMGVGDRGHLHHRLLGAGLSANQATMVLWACSCVLAGVAMWVSRTPA